MANDISIFLRVLPQSLGETQPADAERRLVHLTWPAELVKTCSWLPKMRVQPKNAKMSFSPLSFLKNWRETCCWFKIPSFLEPARSKQTKTTESIVRNKPDLLLGSTHILSLCRHFDSLFGSYQRSGKCRYIHSTPRQLIMHTSKALFACFNVTCSCQG